jgi:hypothetical protein
MHVSIEKDDKKDYDSVSELISGARSRHHVEEVMSRILAKQRTSAKKLPLVHTDQENGGTDDRWH